MTKLKIDHVGIAVRSLAEATGLWEALGLQVEATEEVCEQQVRVAFLPVGDTRLELLEATDPGSAIARHIERRGPGLHHLCLEVADIRTTMAELSAGGYQLLSDEPQPGAHGSLVCFVHPRSAGGVLVELSQPGSDHGRD